MLLIIISMQDKLCCISQHTLRIQSSMIWSVKTRKSDLSLTEMPIMAENYHSLLIIWLPPSPKF